MPLRLTAPAPSWFDTDPGCGEWELRLDESPVNSTAFLFVARLGVDELDDITRDDSAERTPGLCSRLAVLLARLPDLTPGLV
jgi:hypothetical protein